MKTRRPGGLWAGLSRRAPARARADRPFAALAGRLGAASAPRNGATGGVYAGLAARTDLAQYRPVRATGVVEERVEEDGQTFLVLRSPAGRYMRLSDAEGELWRAMDGTQSVAALATAGFLRFRQLLPVADLVQSLRQAGFLADEPVGLYRCLRRRLSEAGLEGWGRRLARALRSPQLAIGGVDALAGALHRWGGWLLFTWLAAALLALLVAVGAFAFALVGAGTWRAYSLVDAASLGPSLLALWTALLVSFVLHELAHAVAVKHYGRRVLRGGVMLYYGMPAAFVDTSDIWLAGRRARIVVSLAGPLCDLAVGSLAAIAAAALPAGWAGAAAYKLAAASYLAALFNLNPLLELDGYYILSDWLGLPSLRRRALDFMRGPLWQKLRARAALSREERIYTVYGALTALYTAVAVMLALAFWQRQLARVLAELWARGDLAGRLVAALVVVAVVLPVALGLLVAAWGLVAAAAGWAARRGYGRNPLAVAATLAALAGALALLPLRFGAGVETMLLAPLLWLVALGAQLALHADYRGAAVAPALDAFLAVTVLELAAQVGLLLLPDQLLLWTAIENLGFALLLFAGLVALLDVDLRQSPTGELAASAVLLAAAFLAGGLAIGAIQAARPGLTPLALVLLAAPVYCTVVALAMLLPLVGSLHDSRLLWSWLLLWVGIAAQAGAYMLELLAGAGPTPLALAAVVLAAGLWAAAWCAHVVALRQPAPGELRWPVEPTVGEAEQLQRAFRHTYAGLYRLLRAYGGARRAKALDDRMDVLAATANWEITLDHEQARVGVELAAQPLDVQGGRYAEVLRYTVAEIARLAGATFATRAIRAAYDALPWPEREAADRRCFPATPWARELSRAFGDVRAARLRLLRQVERFAACDDAELAALAAAFEARRMSAGAAVPRENPGDLWVVEAGEVTAREDGRVVAELHRGASFGGGDAEPPGREYWASVDSDLLMLPASALAALLRGAAPNAATGEALAQMVRALERSPVFHDLPRETLRRLALQAELLRLPPRTPIVRQGLPNGRLYLIVEGEAVVLQRLDGAEGEPGGRRVVARLRPTELFGEVELLRGTLPVASVVAVTPIVLLALPHAAVAGLLASAADVGRGLERIGSGRLLALRAEA